MFSLNETNQFMVYGNSVDLRKGVEPLCGIARSSGQKPADGSVYVFFNRSRTLMKLLHWERGGYVIYYKRMEVGRISRKVFRQQYRPGTVIADQAAVIAAKDAEARRAAGRRRVRASARA